MVNAKSRLPISRGSLAAASGAVIVLVAVLAGAVAIGMPLPTHLPAGTTVAPVDTAGVNLLEPANAAIGSQIGKPTDSQSVERVVEEWTPTGGGSGGGGSPKK